MPSIAELRSRLAAAQSQKAKPRLSNIQCIDILLKVCRKHDLNVITSIDGMLFCTIEEVEAQVENELMCRGGRIALFELNNMLNFQPDHIDRAVENVINDTDKYINSHGVIISRDYLRNMMIAINDTIQECGTVDIAELSKEFDMPFDMIKAHVSAHIGGLIKGTLNGNTIESHTFEQRKVNNMKVALLSVTVPVLTSDVSRLIKININSVNDHFAALLKSGDAKGLLKGGEYTPQCYLDAVEKYLGNYYARNGFAELKLVRSFPHVDLKTTNRLFPNNVKLDSVYINKDLFEPLSILINEAISEKTWREVSSMLPASLNRADWAVVIASIKNAQKNGRLVEGAYVSDAFTADLVKHLVKAINDGRDSVELFHKTFAEAKLGSDHLRLCVEAALGEGDDHFAYLYQAYPEQVFELVEVDLKKDLLSVIVAANKAVKSTVEKKTGKDTTEKIVSHMMEAELTLKTFEKAQSDPMNVVLQFMAKELCVTTFNLLLEYYLTNNKLVEGAVDLDPGNRAALIELISDGEVKQHFKEFTGHLRKKDAGQAVATARELCKLMYVNYNVKKDSRNFIKAKQAQFHQQLSSLTDLDALKACYVCTSLTLLKANHHAFLCDKLWCLKETMALLKALIGGSENFKLIDEIVAMSDKLEAVGEGEEPDIVALQAKTAELIAAFKP